LTPGTERGGGSAITNMLLHRLPDTKRNVGRRLSLGPLFAFLAALWTVFFLKPAPAAALLEEEKNTIDIYERVASSVVNITTSVCEPEILFCPVPQAAGLGSGIIIRKEGLIVTNHHVIADARSLRVTLSDGTQAEARVVASAPEHDIAVIRIDVPKKPLRAITMGDSEGLRVGEKVLAIGNPFGLGQTLTTGTVSMLGRDIKTDGMILRGLIQTDASINPGSSGGALVDSKGELVGMSTITLSPTGGNVGIGFAIPVNRIKTVTPGLISTWRRSLGWIAAAAIAAWIIRRIYRAGR